MQMVSPDPISRTSKRSFSGALPVAQHNLLHTTPLATAAGLG
jgi:hypothetical protein